MSKFGILKSLIKCWKEHWNLSENWNTERLKLGNKILGIEVWKEN